MQNAFSKYTKIYVRIISKEYNGQKSNNIINLLKFIRMKNLFRKNYNEIILSLLACFCFFACSEKVPFLEDEELIISENQSNLDPIRFSPSSLPVYYFNWETVDWMPTPPGQSQIPPPWTGQGALSYMYGPEVYNDHKALDGWELMYSTFNPNSNGQLNNPYFVLYNKYRGLMRIYFYLTTQGFATSSYLQDGISISSSLSTSMLNFLGQDLVDATLNQKIYTQNQPAPSDGSRPLASNRWYMMQYEIAYDPNLSQINSGNIGLNWYLNYCDIANVNLGGGVTGSLNGAIGVASSSSDNFLSTFNSKGKAVGTGVLAGVGKKMIDDNTINSTTGENKLGLPKDLFKNVATSVAKAYTNLPGAAIDLLSSVFGGSSGGPTPVSFTLRADIEMNGSITNSGAFPSTPILFSIPGTLGIPTQGYVPFYNQSLGVVNFNGKPIIETKLKLGSFTAEDPWNGYVYTNTTYTLTFPSSIDYSSFLIINPEVKKIANVVIEKQSMVTIINKDYNNPNFPSIGYVSSPSSYYWQTGYTEQGSYLSPEPPFDIGVRFTIKVTPLNGSPSSTIIKTFKLQEKRVII